MQLGHTLHTLTNQYRHQTIASSIRLFHARAAAQPLRNLPQMCSSTTKAMKSRLSTSTVVGPLCGESKRDAHEHNSVRECDECGSAANSLDAAAAGTVLEAATSHTPRQPLQPQQQQLQRHCVLKE